MPPQIEKILFASDLSERSTHAFQYASSLAARYGASIVLLHVVEPPTDGIQHRLDLVLGEGSVARLREAQEQKAKEILIGKRGDLQGVEERLAEYYGTDVAKGKQVVESFDVVIKEGKAPEEILKAVEAHSCDMVVLGGHKGLLGSGVGSVAKHLLHRSRVPVLIVPLAETD